MKLLWKPVKCYESFYEVNNYGLIKRVLAGQGARANREVKSFVGTDGYKTIRLSKNGGPKTLRIHRIVAEAFIGNIPQTYEVNHKDGNKQNNHVSNLEIVTRRENLIHSYAYLGRKNNPPKGSKNKFAKLTENDVKFIKTHTPSYGVGAKLARQFGVSRTVICNVFKGRSWVHV